jgi:hypothetical protein
VAGVAANVADEVDSVIRPEYNGVQIAQAIRSEESPETFTWLVHLGARQELIQVNPSQAEVVYTDGTEAFLITAEPAHDATGKPVPTSLAVSGDELTVEVEFHGGGFIFPVVAGEGWETSYTTPVFVEGPEDETQIREREQREREEAEQRAREAAEADAPMISLEEAERLLTPGGASAVEAPAPEAGSQGGAIGSGIRIFPLEVYSCSNWELPGESGCEVYKLHFSDGYFIRTSEGASVFNHEFNCVGEIPKHNWDLVLDISLNGGGWHEPYEVRKGSGRKLIAYCHYGITFNYLPEFGSLSGSFSLIDFIYPNGFQEGVVRELAPRVLAD